MKRGMTLLLVCALAAALLCGCTQAQTQERYQVVWLDLFDTESTLTGYAASQEEFDEIALSVHERLLTLHRLSDIYYTYDGMNNLATVNAAAGGEPVAVESDLLALLLACRSYYTVTNGRVNAAMGSVLRLWHDARESADENGGVLPSDEALTEAAEHTSFDTVVIDQAASAVCLTDAAQSLDVGALAKGWAAQQAAQLLPDGYLLNLGGNVVASGSKPGNEPWTIAIQNPDGGDYLRTVSLTDCSAVTSGDYQRYFMVDGVRYCHIIDPDTLYPATYFRSVTILCADSSLADCLSTALFTLPLEDGKALLSGFDAEAMWVDADGSIFYSDGFPAE